ncbi:hypothetical protein BsWGS_10958 [Bradybaena similaris]
MAGRNPADPLIDPHHESVGYSNDDFETVEAPGSLTDFVVGKAESPVSGSASYDRSQDDEVSTTTSSTDNTGTWFKGVDPRVKDLIYWRDVKKTAVVFGTMLVVLLSLVIFSFVIVVAYLSLAVLTVTFSFVVYKKIMGAVQKSNDGHPFRPLLEMDITLSEDRLKSVIQSILKNTNCALNEVRRLFLVEDLVDSIKFGILLWALTYIGSWFNGMSLLILALILLFTVPKVYETYQVQIDHYISLAKTQIDNVLTIIQNKLPFLKKKEKAQ